MYNKKILFAPWAANNKSYTSNQSWYGPLKRLFKNFISFDPQEELTKLGKKRMNEKFINLVSKEKPDYIFFWLIYDEFLLETFVKIREVSPKTKLINFFGDDDILYDNFSKYYADFFDYGLIFQKSYLKKYEINGLLKVYPSFGATTSIFLPKKSEKKHDVTFIGTPKRDRYEIIKYLHQNGFNIKVFGEGWGNYPDLHSIVGGKLSQGEMIKIINESKISLSFSKNYLGNSHIKGRIFEIMACKSFLLSENFEDSNKFFKSDELVTFKDKEDLVNKIRYYLSHEKEREKIASNGYKRVIKDYNQDAKLENAFRVIIKDKGMPKKLNMNYSGDIIYLDSKMMSLGKDHIKDLIKKYEYICFNKNSIPLKYKESIQIKSLKSTNKPISCCDYYVFSPSLGDYLASYGKYSYFYLGKGDFNSIVSPAQLMVKKEYFLDNISIFKMMISGKKTNLIDENNTAFITIPLVRINGLNNLNEIKKSKAFIFSFENQINKLMKERRILTTSYIYKLFINSLLRRDFIWKHLLIKLFARFNFTRL